MGRPRDPRRFTRKETIERLQEAKSYLGNKERLAFMRTGSVYIPAGYKPDDDESYYAAPKLSEFDLQCLADETKSFIGHNWRADNRFRILNAVEFADWEFGRGASIGESVVIVFYPWKDKTKTSKIATLWLGTWHHSPLVAWTGGIFAIGNPKVRVDYLSNYIDLVH